MSDKLVLELEYHCLRFKLAHAEIHTLPKVYDAIMRIRYLFHSSTASTPLRAVIGQKWSPLRPAYCITIIAAPVSCISIAIAAKRF